MKSVLSLFLLFSVPQTVLTYGVKIPKTNAIEQLAKNTERINKRGSNNRIVGGIEVEISEYSSAASYLTPLDGGVTCTGVFISKGVVLTAAHCLYNQTTGVVPAKNVRVSGGTKLIVYESPKNYTVQKVMAHPSFDLLTGKNDIALLFLSNDITDPSITFAKIYNNTITDDTLVEAAGWGYTTKDGSTNVSDVLKAVPIDISSSQKCNDNYQFWESNNGSSICTMIKNGEDTCPGDSGGPLYFTGDSSKPIVGLTSFGSGSANSTNICGIDGNTSFYTNAQKYIDWILKNTQIDAKDLVYKTSLSETKPKPSRTSMSKTNSNPSRVPKTEAQAKPTRVPKTEAQAKPSKAPKTKAQAKPTR
ncbi:hypothetical protein BB558_006650, partial [Smittium angustum]